MQNWLDCIRTREQPVADVEIGHRSITVCHLVNLTLRLQRRLKWDPVKEQFLGDDEANKLVDRPRRKGYELPDPVENPCRATKSPKCSPGSRSGA